MGTSFIMMARPALFETPEELQEKIDAYFKEGVAFKTVVIGPANNRSTITIEVPTITGLCYFLGFESRQSFYDLEKRSEFSYTIKRARLFIEKHYEEMLQSGNTTGAIFALKNFDWKDRTEVDQNVKGGLNIRFEEPEEYKRLYPSQDQGNIGDLDGGQ